MSSSRDVEAAGSRNTSLNSQNVSVSPLLAHRQRRRDAIRIPENCCVFNSLYVAHRSLQCSNRALVARLTVPPYSMTHVVQPRTAAAVGLGAALQH
jgi:hypothetical protein